jgi:pyruvate dehydrogenase E1 component alpha subunit
MSCEDVHEAIAAACKRAREEGTPTFLEILTYRYKGHSMSDPAKYRSKEEVEEFKNQDPITSVLHTILENKYATQEELDGYENDIMEVVNASVEFAENSPWPDPSEIYTDNYVQNDYPYLVDKY